MTIGLLPLLLIVLATTLELGALRVVEARAHSAADLAVLVAVNDQDDGELDRTGRLAPATDAAVMARVLFAENLEGISGALALTPDTIAARASVLVTSRPPEVLVEEAIDRSRMFGRTAGHVGARVRVGSGVGGLASRAGGAP